MMNQKRPHAGFPEAALSKYSERLVSLGYKVGVVDQTETPEMLAAANKENATKRKAVQRELSSVLTPGTIVDAAVVGSHNAVYTLALTERALTSDEIAANQARFRAAADDPTTIDTKALGSLVDASGDSSRGVVEIGFAYADCATGRFVIGQTVDDDQRSFLRTLLGFIGPRELVLPRGRVSPETEHVLLNELPANTIHNLLTPDVEFWSPEKTKTELNQGKYFAGAKTESGVVDPMEDWPLALAQAVKAKENLLLSAFGALTHYLRRTMHDRELLSQKHVQVSRTGATRPRRGWDASLLGIHRS